MVSTAIPTHQNVISSFFSIMVEQDRCTDFYTAAINYCENIFSVKCGTKTFSLYGSYIMNASSLKLRQALRRQNFEKNFALLIEACTDSFTFSASYWKTQTILFFYLFADSQERAFMLFLISTHSSESCQCLDLHLSFRKC